MKSATQLKSWRPPLPSAAASILFLGLAAAAAAPAPVLATGVPLQGRVFCAHTSGIIAFNANGTNEVNYTPSDSGPAVHSPSVSRDGAKIAFTATLPNQSPHIWVMNGDGTGVTQLTTEGGQTVSGNYTPYYDIDPAISPDGTKILFLSNRGDVVNTDPYTGNTYVNNDANIWEMNSDGSNMTMLQGEEPYQQYSYPYGNYTAFGGHFSAVVWGPDNATYAYRGQRQSPPASNSFHFVVGVSNSTNFLDVYDSTGESSTLDWSPDGQYLVYTLGGEAQSAPPPRMRFLTLSNGSIRELYQFDSKGNEVVPMSTGYGTVRFAPNSKQVISYDGYGGTYYTYSLDGSHKSSFTLNGETARGEPMWWASGSTIPVPDHLAISPNPIRVRVGGSVQLTPTLYDASGNVIVHAVRDWNAVGGNSSRYLIDWFGNLTAYGINDQGQPYIAPDNGGVTAPNDDVAINTVHLKFVSLSKDVSGGVVHFHVKVTNTGDGPAGTLRLTSATLGGVAANSSTGLPLAWSFVDPGVSETFDLYYQQSDVGAKGSTQTLEFKGTYVGGSYTSDISVKVP